MIRTSEIQLLHVDIRFVVDSKGNTVDRGSVGRRQDERDQLLLQAAFFRKGDLRGSALLRV